MRAIILFGGLRRDASRRHPRSSSPLFVLPLAKSLLCHAASEYCNDVIPSLVFSRWGNGTSLTEFSSSEPQQHLHNLDLSHSLPKRPLLFLEATTSWAAQSPERERPKKWAVFLGAALLASTANHLSLFPSLPPFWGVGGRLRHSFLTPRNKALKERREGVKGGC